MKNYFLFLCVCFFILSCKEQNQSEKKIDQKETTVAVPNSNVPSLSYNELKPLLNKKDNKIYVINFWATWCAPCIKELPYFEKINQDYKDKNVEVLLVSLDFPKKKESKLLPYIKKKNLQSKVVLLDDTNEQFWIADINEKWSGAIPATIIYNKDKRQFYEKSFTEEELIAQVQKFIN